MRETGRSVTYLGTSLPDLTVHRHTALGLTAECRWTVRSGISELQFIGAGEGRVGVAMQFWLLKSVPVSGVSCL